jgi:hypothetical protein
MHHSVRPVDFSSVCISKANLMIKFAPMSYSQIWRTNLRTRKLSVLGSLHIDLFVEPA